MLEFKTAEDSPTTPSERSFGTVFAVFFTLVALLPMLSGHSVHWPALAAAAAFALAAWLAPRLLAPLNVAWARLGAVLHKITSPLVLGLIFFLIITPAGLIRRALRADPMGMAADRNARTYWQERDPPGPSPSSLDRQF